MFKNTQKHALIVLIEISLTSFAAEAHAIAPDPDWRFMVRRIVENNPRFDQSVFDIRIPPRFYMTDKRQDVSYWVGEQRGNVVLLNFFTTWCGWCQAELPHLQRIWMEFRTSQTFRMLIMKELRQSPPHETAAQGTP